MHASLNRILWLAGQDEAAFTASGRKLLPACRGQRGVQVSASRGGHQKHLQKHIGKATNVSGVLGPGCGEAEGTSGQAGRKKEPRGTRWTGGRVLQVQRHLR